MPRPPAQNEPVEIEDYCTAIRDTQPGVMNAGALLIEHDDDEVWIPKSLIDEDSVVYNATSHAEGMLKIPFWLAIEKGLA